MNMNLKKLHTMLFTSGRHHFSLSFPHIAERPPEQQGKNSPSKIGETIRLDGLIIRLFLAFLGLVAF